MDKGRERAGVEEGEGEEGIWTGAEREKERGGWQGVIRPLNEHLA